MLILQFCFQCQSEKAAVKAQKEKQQPSRKKHLQNINYLTEMFTTICNRQLTDWSGFGQTEIFTQ